jgi:cbb3-type cytochrome oxidase maturation protein
LGLTTVTPREFLYKYFWPQLKLNSVSALFLLIGISIIVAGSFLTAFLWSVKNGQYDDDYTPSVRMLFDDELKTETTTSTPEIKIQNK